MTEEEKKRLREALAAAKNAGSWKVPTGTSKPKVATVGGIDEGSEHNRGSVSDLRKNYASQPKAAETKVATVGGISEGSDYNRGSISELRKNAPSAAKSKVAAVGDSAFAGVTGFNRGLTGILGAAADLVDPMYKFIEEQSFYQGAPAWSQKAIDLVTGRMAQQNLKKTADYYKKSDEEAQAQVQKNIEAGQMGEIGNALIQGTVQAVPSVAAAWMGAGIPAASQSLAGTVNGAKTTAQMMGSAVKEMASKPQFILSAAQSFGGAYDEALAKGADTGEAITAAVLTAFPEAMIESMGGTEKLVEKIAGEAGRKGVKGAIQDILQNMAEEGLEEIVQYPVGKMAAMGYDPDMKLYSTTEEAVINPVEMGKAAAMGAAIGGIMGGGAKAGDVVVGKTVSSVGDMVWTERLGKEIRDQDGGTALIRAAMESGDGKLQTEAERLTGKLQQGEKLTNRELADLYQAEVEAGIDTYSEENIVKRALTRPDALQTEKDPATVAGMEERTASSLTREELVARARKEADVLRASREMKDASWRQRMLQKDGRTFLMAREGEGVYLIPKRQEIDVSVGEGGRVQLLTDELERVDAHDRRDFIKAYAKENFVTQYDDRGSVISAKPFTIASDGSEVLVVQNGIEDVCKKIRGRGGKNARHNIQHNGSGSNDRECCF